MHKSKGSSLVQLMAWKMGPVHCQAITKPKGSYCYLDCWEQCSVKFKELNYNNFKLGKKHFKIWLNVSHFAWASIYIMYHTKPHDLADSFYSRLKKKMFTFKLICICNFILQFLKLIHWSIVLPYGDRDLGQHWLRKWLVAWWHQAITWSNVCIPLI